MGRKGAGPSALRTEDEDFVDFLDEEEALELVEFDPKVEAKDTWPPPKSMKTLSISISPYQKRKGRLF